MYSGQLDVIVAAPLTERFLPTVNWTGADEYKQAERYYWKVQPSDTEIAGYIRQVEEFYQVSTFYLLYIFYLICNSIGQMGQYLQQFVLQKLCYVSVGICVELASNLSILSLHFPCHLCILLRLRP